MRLKNMDRNTLPTDVESLRKLLLQTQKAFAATQQKLEVSQQQVAELSTTVEDQLSKLEAKDQQIVELLRALRGKKRELVDPDQLLLFNVGEFEQLLEEAAEETQPARRKRKHGRRLIPDDVPHEEVVHELPEAERLCPHDGQPMPLIRYEVSKQLEFVPAQVKVLVHKRAVYACSAKHDEAKLFTAPKPPQPIEKGLAGPGLLSAMAVGKFGDHLPGYRLEDILSRHGVEIRRSTIYDWLSSVADLVTPLYELMKDRVLKSKVIHTDDTQVKLIDKTQRQTKLARFWAYIGDGDHPYTIYDFTETRERAGPEKFLQGFEGYLQADAYGGYDGIYWGSKGKIQEVACWVHCRRYWWKAREQDPQRAHYVLAIIRKLNDIERAGKNSQSLQSQRIEHAVPLLAELKQWLDEQEFLPKSLIGKAATYTRNQWDALNRYVDDECLSIDNNEAERAMKTIAIGRKAWLFVGSPIAGERASRLMSLIATCKANRVEPWMYLKEAFTKIPQGVEIEQLLPDQWLKQNPQHRWTIADQRKEEREKKAI